ncbi:4Fe-4S dicluster domain-containing protein [Clostridium botulinum]|nr:4Fe-4S dicluster domain-containing protein [Clostridium botulinum]NFH89652.1 4Fe-4S dicluster domain-containing protein [Clostridium botulinum]NFI16855.1 4Fe-4S dicluster domain-containing protein [Clostridium botulinum]NFI54383.1 4Fe-4S dicluster domain-containing protein [Clostridium botulinum]NFL91569.1 4Fe-4S dicluster domain-containing protein [Clostridium botulinum]
MNKNLKILYFSPTDGTKKIIKTIASSINSNYEEFDITLAKNRVKNIEFSHNDLVIIGTPTYAGRFPKLLISYLDKIIANSTLAVFVTTYGNRDYEDALLEQYDIFTSKGFIALGAATFITEHSSTDKLATGRPNIDDLKVASNFAANLLKRLNTLNSLSDLNTLSLPGNRPYVVKNIAMPPLTPETNEKCITCGICEKHCPTSAIDFSDCKTIDPGKCIKCNSCVKRCPFNAKSITHDAYKNMQNMLISNFADKPRNPELFLA